MISLLITPLFCLQGQSSKFNIEAGYPIPIGNNFIQRNYYGIVDLGAGYRFANPKPVSIGFSFHGSVFRINNINDVGVNGVRVNSYWFKPRIFAELNPELLANFQPSLAIGYSFLAFDVNDADLANQDSTESGFNLNLGLAYHVSRRLYLKFQYDFIKLSLDDEIPDITFNNSVHVLYLCLGVKL